VRAISLHPDVIVLTSRLWQTTCTVVHAAANVSGNQTARMEEEAGSSSLLNVIPPVSSVPPVPPALVPSASPVSPTSPVPPVAPASKGSPILPEGETFLIDSPILPDELEILPAVLAQAGFTLSGLLATHADWDHLLGRLAFPGAALGCAETTAARLRSAPGEPQRELRAFDEQHYVERARPLSLASVEALPVPGRCEIGAHELELHPTDGHTEDGMAVWVPWARVLVAGDYLSSVEIPVLGHGGSVDAYLATLERLRPLVEAAEHIVPGHGPVLGSARGLELLGEDTAYLRALGETGTVAPLPTSRRGKAQQDVHAANLAILAR
jgi:glyoxylase-like metal-dependent hydrolase (beta-lactamase superfamily II)